MTANDRSSPTRRLAWKAAHDMVTVLRFEVLEAVRSRRVLVLAMLYLGGAALGTYIFASLLSELEATVGAALPAVDATGAPGALSQTLAKTQEVQALLARLLDDEALARELTDIPPVALFYGWLGCTFGPVFVMLTASETVAQDLGSGSARYVLVRTDPLYWATGKLLGQAVMMVVCLLLGAGLCLAIAVSMLDGLEAGETLLWLLRLAGRAAVLSFAYLGVALGVSHLTRSVPIARGLGLAALVFMGLSLDILRAPFVHDSAPVVIEALIQLFPRAHELDLWRPELSTRLPAMVILLALGAGYFGLGVVYRSRRDR